MRITLAHDSFTQYGGAERLLEAVHELYPESPVYTIVVDKQQAPKYTSWNIVPSFLQHIYNVYPHFQQLFPLVPVALKFLRPKAADILLSFSSSYIKGLRKPAGALHINYCHTPTRFIWQDMKYAEMQIPALLRPFARLYFSWLRGWDLRAAKNIDYFLANSKEVQRRIKETYGRDSKVVYPFVDVNFWRPTQPKSDYFLIGGRLQPHKKNEQVIRLFNRLGLPLHVVGTGRQENYLKSIAKPNITFLGRISDEEFRDEYSGALAFIYPPYEDFGMMALEAAACGTATLGLGQAGILEAVVPGKTGELFSEATEDALEPLVKNWDPSRYSTSDLTAFAARFSKERFQKEITDFVTYAYENRH